MAAHMTTRGTVPESVKPQLLAHKTRRQGAAAQDGVVDLEQESTRAGAAIVGGADE
jgi:hypothetical protein